jgi:hypothetical protein
VGAVTVTNYHSMAAPQSFAFTIIISMIICGLAEVSRSITLLLLLLFLL